MRKLLFVILSLYILSWLTIVPSIHNESLKQNNKEMGEPLKVISQSDKSLINDFFPYLSVYKEVERPDYSEEKNPIKYKETNTSIVLPVLPFVFYYYRSYSSGGIFNFGKKGFLLNVFGIKRNFLNGNWIT